MFQLKQFYINLEDMKLLWPKFNVNIAIQLLRDNNLIIVSNEEFKKMVYNKAGIIKYHDIKIPCLFFTTT